MDVYVFMYVFILNKIFNELCRLSDFFYIVNVYILLWYLDMKLYFGIE